MASEMFLSQATSTDRRGKWGLPRPFAVWDGDVEIALCILAAVESLRGRLESDQSGVEIEAGKERDMRSVE